MENKKEKEIGFVEQTTHFLQEVWNEIDFRKGKGRVSWPTWDSVKASTNVVIFSSIGLGVFIAVLDFFLGRGLEFIIKSTVSNGIG
jgi:preprotein translocase SecE subunit